MAERRAGGEPRVRRESIEDVDSPRNSKSIHDRLGERVKDHENSPKKRGSRDLDRSGDEKRRRVMREEKPLPDEVVKRSKRMFGRLMGHLGQAKKQLAKDSDLLQKQDRLLLAADAKTKEQSQRVNSLAHQKSEIRRLETTLSTTKQTAKERIAKLERQLTLSIDYERYQARFLRTTAPIPIFYLPARHTKETQAVVDASMEAVEEKIKVRRRELEGKKREIEAELKRKVEVLEEKLQKVKESDPDKAKAKEDNEDTTNEEDDKEKDSKDDEDKKKDDAMGEETSDKDVADENVDSNNDDNDQSMEEDTSLDKEQNDKENANEDKDSTQENREDTEQVKEGTSPNEDAPTSPAKPSEPEAASPKPAASPSAPLPTAASPVAKEGALDTETPAAIATTPETQPTSLSARTPKSEIPAISKLKVVELKRYLKERDLDTKGLKADLASRLEEALADEE